MKGALYTHPPFPAIKLMFKWLLTVAIPSSPRKRQRRSEAPLSRFTPETEILLLKHRRRGDSHAAGEKPSKDLYSRNSPKA